MTIVKIAKIQKDRTVIAIIATIVKIAAIGWEIAVIAYQDATGVNEVIRKSCD